jgi:hypothetical protein
MLAALLDAVRKAPPNSAPATARIRSRSAQDEWFWSEIKCYKNVRRRHACRRGSSQGFVCFAHSRTRLNR